MKKRLLGRSPWSYLMMMLTAFAAVFVIGFATNAQMIPFAFLRGLVELGSFDISGVTGAADVVQDDWLVNGTEPKITFTSSDGATLYDVIIKSQDEATTLCQSLSSPSTTVTLSGCGLANATVYKAIVLAKAGSASRAASNSGFEFTVDSISPTPNTITGITGGSDVDVDAWLVGSFNPVVQWNAFANASKYDVVIKDMAETSEVCAATDVAGTSHSFSSCTLVNNESYKVFVTAKSPSGYNTSVATNNAFVFGVDNNTLGAFSISGISGDAPDSLVDTYLANGDDPTVHFTASGNAYRYDLEIKNEEGTDTLCTLSNATSSPSLVTCGLAQGLYYKAFVKAKTISEKIELAASNDGFLFSVSEPNATPAGPFLIKGVTGGEDNQIDNFLTSGLVVTAHWQPSPGAESYTVSIRNAADTTTVCAAKTTTQTQTTFAGCSLTLGTNYRVKVSAANPPALQIKAINDSYQFSVVGDSTRPFGIYGVYGGKDEEVDPFLMDGLIASVDWEDADADLYQVTIRNSTNTADVCAMRETSSSYLIFSGCSLSRGSDYLIKVVAKKGNLSTDAVNSPFKFSVPNVLTFCPTGTSTARSLILADSGGVNGTYSNNESCSFTLTPSGSPTYILITGKFSGGDYDDTLNLYDSVTMDGSLNDSYTGPNESDELWAESYSGTAYLTWESNSSQVGPGYELGLSSRLEWPASFDILGVRGGDDAILDEHLTDSFSDGELEWDPSAGAVGYDVLVTDSGYNLVCPKFSTATTSVSLSSCSLTSGFTYTVTVYARNADGEVVRASNSPFLFDYDLAPKAFSIAGVTGGTDASEDTALEDGNIATVTWEASSGETSYEITLFEIDGHSVKCPKVVLGSGVTSHTFAGCALTLGSNYLLELVAKNSSGVRRATNSPLNFVVGAQWFPMIGSEIPQGRTDHSVVWTGSEMIIWGGAYSGYYNTGSRYNPTTDSWSATSVASGVPSPRNWHSTVWTGSEMIVWGGYSAAGVLDTGARYNPASNSWTTISTVGAPSPRQRSVAVWTGTEMIVWSGYDNGNYFDDGARYNPATNTWSAMSSVSSPDARSLASAVWTGTEMIVWGGYSGYTLNSGGRYNPTTNTWAATSIGAGVPSARYLNSYVWTGSEMIIWGGDTGFGYTKTGARYNPGTNSWTTTSTGANSPVAARETSAVWTGTEMIVWGGYTSSYTNTDGGARYNPTTNSWTAMSNSGAPSARRGHTAVWTGTEMIIWGGWTGFGVNSSVGRYNAGSDTWSEGGPFLPVARRNHAAVWTGSEMLIWGGYDPNYGIAGKGARYSPATDSWTPMEESGEPDPRIDFSFVWSGTELIVWGGKSGSTLDSGGRYNPSTDSWQSISMTGAPSARFSAEAVWTGSRMVVWGGQYDWVTLFSDGGVYDPATDSWSAISEPANIFIPSNRSGHKAVWTGSEMIVWGGESSGSSGMAEGPGGRYVPASDSWLAMSEIDSPELRKYHSMIWTGTEVIVWGGDNENWESINTGGRYNPSTDSWLEVSLVGAPGARSYHTAVWTGTEMIVWGGYDQSEDLFYSSGGRYDPTTDSWQATFSLVPAPTARVAHSVVWTGSEVIVWGGEDSNGDTVNSGGRYSPTSDSWSSMTMDQVPSERRHHSAVWTGSEMIVFGGIDSNYDALESGGRYDPATDVWTATSEDNLETGRFAHTAVWTGTDMIVWGGQNNGNYVTGGLSYNPASDSWIEISSSNEPSGRTSHSAVWTGVQMIVWGGEGDTGITNTGGSYDPSTDTWESTFIQVPPPNARREHTSVWTGSEMIVWGGLDEFGQKLNTGGRYNPTTDGWTALDFGFMFDARSQHTAIWTGNQMILWGGVASYGYTNDGIKYSPATGDLDQILNSGLAARGNHTAVWTGTEMIIWGGDTILGSTKTGGHYNPDTQTWGETFWTHIPSPRYQHTSVWTGSEVIVWGGMGNSINGFNTGSRYNPTTDSWQRTSLEDAPIGRAYHTAVWTGTEMIVWGGHKNYSIAIVGQNGGRYNPSTDSWLPTAIDDGTPAARHEHTAIWTGTEMIIWGGGYIEAYNNGGRYNPSTDSWETTFEANIPTPRENHTAVWTGSEMIVWGGATGYYTNQGSIYNPATDSWTSTKTGLTTPKAREGHVAVWTGSEMIVWGGYDGNNFLQSGGAYNPATDSWSSTLVDASTPQAVADASGIWTGSEMIVWGGAGFGRAVATGARYNPGSNTWTETLKSFVPSSRRAYSTVWTGSEMIVWGGHDDGYNFLNSGAKYDPTTDSWSEVSITGAPTPRVAHTSVWSGSVMVVWGGEDNSGESSYVNTGGRYDPVANTWQATSVAGAVPVGRYDHTSVWTGSEMLIWGGQFGPGRLNSGGRYNPNTDSWSSMALASAPSARDRHTAIWTGSKMIVWGGDTNSSETNTGAIYNPASNTWSATSLTSAPAARYFHTAVWSGSEMIVWGGQDGNGDMFSSGARYNPVSNTWNATSESGLAPMPRREHVAVWTGSRMIVWGGVEGDDPEVIVNTGASYDPVADTWSALGASGVAPIAKRGHQAVWTGSEVLVWGGRAQGPDGPISTNSGSRYNPSTGVWADIAQTAFGVPTGRTKHTAIWTGDEMIVWGGTDNLTQLNSGSRYDPDTNTWTVMSTGGSVPNGRYSHAAVWTGTEMIVWGGYDEDFADGSQYANVGGRYNPSSNTWANVAATGAPVGRVEHTAIWTGTDMIVWGGEDDSGVSGQGAKYNPSLDTWTEVLNDEDCSGRRGHTAVWTGTEAIYWGGYGGLDKLNSGCRYNPTTAVWSPTLNAETGGAPSPREGHVAIWTGTEMIIWGGKVSDSYLTNSGGRYNPSTNVWAETSLTSAPSVRTGAAAVWTGTQMIVWGGAGNSNSTISTGGRYNPATDVWTTVSTGANLPAARRLHAAAWTGAEMVVWGGRTGPGSTVTNTGGRYNPTSNTWQSMSASPLESRSDTSAVWTGSEIVIWGGRGSGAFNNGARYNPGTDSWASTADVDNPPGVPLARGSHSAVWTGTEMIIWGGLISGVPQNSGARYELATDTWVSISTGANSPTARSKHTAVWTGTEMIIWGGDDGDLTASGARYTPGTDTWVATSESGAVPLARSGHLTAWTGTKMIIWGGTDNEYADSSSYSATGSVYDPASDTWAAMSAADPVMEPRSQSSAVWTGSEFIVWGGETEEGHSDVGARYILGSDSWINIGEVSTAFAPEARQGHSAVWNGSKMIIWGGYSDDDVLNTGAQYDPVSNVWTATSVTNAPSARVGALSAWTGTHMMVWGGENGDGILSSGALYNPGADSWTSVLSADVGLKETNAVWTGVEFIVWGGRSDENVENLGLRYNPATDAWTPMSTGSGGSGLTSPPVGRAYHTAIWTGTEMLVWGGSTYDDDGDEILLSSGGRYNPSTDSWLKISDASAPSPRGEHTAVWTGSDMIVWGGYDDMYLGDERPSTSSGARYNPTNDTWTETNKVGAPVARRLHTAVWSGSEMIVWGGNVDGEGSRSGARYNPTTDTWSATEVANTPTPRFSHSAIWTGSEMIVFGGEGNYHYLASGGRYDPTTNTWTKVKYVDPNPQLTRRSNTSSVWTGAEMVIWGGFDADNSEYSNTGSRYNPTLDSWQPTAVTAGVPSARVDHYAIWTGTEMIIWGGKSYNAQGEEEYDVSGGRYNPSTNVWHSMADAPNMRSEATAIWTGAEMIIWGGSNTEGAFYGGLRFNPSSNVWIPTSIENFSPRVMQGHTAVWSGSRMIIWGGLNSSYSPVDTGATFEP